MEDSLQYFRAIESLDMIHAEDPRLENGVPIELLYTQRLTTSLLRMDPFASEALLLAARSQHLRRWSIDRNLFPLGPAGYKKWRKALTDLHVSIATETLSKIGYDRSTVSRVQTLIRKENLMMDSESQLLEDAVCLVFLEFELPSFVAKYSEDKVRGALRKSWDKMSTRGKEEALRLSLDENSRKVVLAALAALAA